MKKANYFERGHAGSMEQKSEQICLTLLKVNFPKLRDFLSSFKSLRRRKDTNTQQKSGEKKTKSSINLCVALSVPRGGNWFPSLVISGKRHTFSDRRGFREEPDKLIKCLAIFIISNTIQTRRSPDIQNKTFCLTLVSCLSGSRLRIQLNRSHQWHNDRQVHLSGLGQRLQGDHRGGGGHDERSAQDLKQRPHSVRIRRR